MAISRKANKAYRTKVYENREYRITEVDRSARTGAQVLCVFSRFEYALKVIPRFRQSGNGETKADWRAFAAEIGPYFLPDNDATIKAAFDNLSGANLRYLAVVDGDVEWRPFPVPPNISDAERVICLIKQVRNNLFHGGKYAPDPNTNPDRERQWIESSIVILERFVSLCGDVRAVFEN